MKATPEPISVEALSGLLAFYRNKPSQFHLPERFNQDFDETCYLKDSSENKTMKGCVLGRQARIISYQTTSKILPPLAGPNKIFTLLIFQFFFRDTLRKSLQYFKASFSVREKQCTLDFVARQFDQS